MAAGRVRNKRERRGESLVVVVQLKGDEAKRFDAHRGDQCPRDFAAELVSMGLEKIERSNLDSKPVKGFLR